MADQLRFSDSILNGMRVTYAWRDDFAMPVAEIWIQPVNALGVIQWVRVNERFRGLGLTRRMIESVERHYTAMITAAFTKEADERLLPWFQFDEHLGAYRLRPPAYRPRRSAVTA